MKNIGMKNLEIANVDKFTSNIGMKIRRIIGRPLRYMIKVSSPKKIVKVNKPNLEKHTPYIFVSTHYFNEDTVAAVSSIDRSCYTLVGTTDQLENNPISYTGWINGLVYVNRLDPESRKSSIGKMERLIKNGTSILIFPEGAWNNTENLLCLPLFAGPYKLGVKTGAKIVPIASYYEEETEKVYTCFGEPIDVKNKEKKEALTEIRDSMATMMFNLMKTYSKEIKRESLQGNLHLKHLNKRKAEYMKTPWTKDVWDEEITVYQSKDITMKEDVDKTFDNVKVTPENANIIAPIFADIEEAENYNFKTYMKRNWNK